MMQIFYYFDISVSLCFSSRKKLNDKIVNLLQQKSLIDDGVCAPPRAQQVVDQHMLPLVGERQRVFENNLETMEVCPFPGSPQRMIRFIKNMLCDTTTSGKFLWKNELVSCVKTILF